MFICDRGLIVIVGVLCQKFVRKILIQLGQSFASTEKKTCDCFKHFFEKSCYCEVELLDLTAYKECGHRGFTVLCIIFARLSDSFETNSCDDNRPTSSRKSVRVKRSIQKAIRKMKRTNTRRKGSDVTSCQSPPSITKNNFGFEKLYFFKSFLEMTFNVCVMGKCTNSLIFCCTQMCLVMFCLLLAVTKLLFRVLTPLGSKVL